MHDNDGFQSSDLVYIVKILDNQIDRQTDRWIDGWTEVQTENIHRQLIQM